MGLIEGLMNQCLKGDAKNDINEVVRHLKDPQEMGQQIVANRLSIEQDVITAITDGLGERWQGTGKAAGEALRMVLLDARSGAASNANIISAVSVGKSGGSRRRFTKSGAIRIPAVLMVTAVALAVFIGFMAVRVVRAVSAERSVSNLRMTRRRPPFASSA